MAAQQQQQLSHYSSAAPAAQQLAAIPAQTALQPCSHAAMQPCSLAAVQPCSRAVVQPCNHAALQPCSRAAVQPCSLTAMQPCSLTAVQLCSRAALQPCSRSALQLCSINLQPDSLRKQPCSCNFINLWSCSLNKNTQNLTYQQWTYCPATKKKPWHPCRKELLQLRHDMCLYYTHKCKGNTDVRMLCNVASGATRTACKACTDAMPLALYNNMTRSCVSTGPQQWLMLLKFHCCLES